MNNIRCIGKSSINPVDQILVLMLDLVITMLDCIVGSITRAARDDESEACSTRIDMIYVPAIVFKGVKE
jgi:hypothetical protein